MEEVKYIPGDLVQYKQIPNKVCTIKGIISELDKPKIIEKKAPIYEAIIGDNEGLVYLNDDDILGIPITSEILEKNGWKRNGGQYSFTYKPYAGDKVELIGFFIEMFKDEHDMLKYRYFQIFLENKVICGCFYVHQLQHLLFGLGINYEMEV